MYKRIVFILASFLLVTGAHAKRVSVDKVVPVQSLVHLHAEMVYQPQQVAVYIQGGKVVAPNSIDVYRPHCSLALDRKAHRVTRILPDSFVVYKVKYNNASASMWRPSSTLPVASVIGGAVSWEMYSTVIYIKSEKQPQIYQLTCEHMDDPQNPKYLSVRQIRSTLGDLMSVELRSRLD